MYDIYYCYIISIVTLFLGAPEANPTDAQARHQASHRGLQEGAVVGTPSSPTDS